MTDQGLAGQGSGPRRSVIDTLEIDVRLLGMLMAFAAVAMGRTFGMPRAWIRSNVP